MHAPCVLALLGSQAPRTSRELSINHLEGIALLRGFSGTYDRDFTLARLREVQALLNSVEERGEGVEARPITTRDGYALWADSYDEPGNQVIDLEQPVVREILDGLPAGVALDAACGTGRHTAYLASAGHRVIGVDTSPEMLAVARKRVPAGDSTRPTSPTCRSRTTPSIWCCARSRSATSLTWRPCFPSSCACFGPAGTWSSPTRAG